MNRLELVRRMGGLTLDGLADKSGISRTTAHNVESGKVTPTSRTCRKIADALGAPVAWLFENEDHEGEG